MNIKTKTLITGLTLAVFTTFAQADVSKDEYCEHIYQYSKDAMEFRQSATPAREVKEKMPIYTKLHAAVLNKAYSTVVFNNKKQSKVAVNDFASSQSSACETFWSTVKKKHAKAGHIEHYKEQRK